VQRVPVRIALEPKELASHPLQVGLSLSAEIDTHERGGPRLTREPSGAQAQSTAVFDAAERRAAEAVQRIIRENAGRPRG
jgi:membrane fusion protein (multidrug efflux system)